MRTTILAIAWMIACGTVLAQPAQPARPAAPTTQPAAPAPAEAGKSLKATVVSVTGSAQKMNATQAEAKWEALQAGQELDELTVIRTGMRSRVVLNLAGRGEFTIESATKMGIGELRQKGSLVSAQVGLKYGMVRAVVEGSRGPNDVRVSTPTAALAVRGSRADIAFSEVGLGLKVDQSVWQARNVQRVRNVYPGQVTDNNLTPFYNLAPILRAIYLADDRGLTSQERDFLANYGQGRGQIRFLRELERSDFSSSADYSYLSDLPACCGWIRNIISRPGGYYPGSAGYPTYPGYPSQYTSPSPAR